MDGGLVWEILQRGKDHTLNERGCGALSKNCAARVNIRPEDRLTVPA